MKIAHKIIFLFLLFFANLALARVENFIDEANDIKDILKQSVEVYKGGDWAKAKKLSEDAYFQRFENLEGAIGRNIGKKAIVMERKFVNLRRLYKDNAPIVQINALVESLCYDLDEVAPILQKGFRLKAEASDTNYDKVAAEISSIKENEKREAEAELMIAQMMGISVEELRKQENSNNQVSQNIDNTNDSVQADLQAAAAMDMRLQFILDNISTKFSQAASAFHANNIEESKKFLNDALFNDYRNTKIEVLINSFVGAKSDQKIQQGIRKIISRMNENNIDEKEFRDNLSSIEEELFDAFVKLPENELSTLKLVGFKDTNAGKDYTKVANDIKIALDKILQDYDGFSVSIIDDLQNVYLDIFEASGMESKIGAVDSNLKFKIEAFFSKGVALIKANVDKNELSACFDELNSAISSSIDLIQESSPYSLFIWSLVIILREGLEALIIVVAIVSYLIQSGNKNRLNITYSALFTGVILSFITAFIVAWIFKENAGQKRELIEGVTMLIAVALLFYVGFWLLSNANNKKWVKFIKDQTIEAISNNSAKTLWFTVFLAVYREGAETVLFYQALLIDSKTSTDYTAVFVGLGVGIVILVALYFLLKAGAIRIPVKQFFYVVSYIIFYMVFIFTGKGIAELIEGKVIIPTLTPFKFEPITTFGIYPYYETLIPQILVLILLVSGILITHKISKKGAIK
ncbi:MULTISPECIES: FTR1 family protein [unclassified Campylobacter]|uniref:FTR1 family iron permease n=1 Tax=unclassified Campylobacter TaxID=2593542 RepID=UPI001237A130|nr:MULTISPECIES: FTR1 family protein [unclassified Campylobacter]KAA6228437.1 iron permease [Campylobacter sp. LR185c]KAA6228924.1 iron permease [Campylobacter sp. LR196d]KAA6229409.1 iron permease [Campylobacter sp. LR286c]KAA8603712.1 iron permease [Campylobacter sp. LR185c]